MRAIQFFAAVVSILFLSIPAFSQNRWEAQFRPGLNFATEAFAGVDIKTGFGFEITAAYNFLPQLGIYTGWGWQEFRAADTFETAPVNIQETGHTLGLQFVQPMGRSNISYILQGGVLFHQVQLENNLRETLADTNYGFGWQAGAGLDIGIGSTISLRPTLRYRSLSREVQMNNNPYETKLAYVSIGIGLVKGF